MRKLLFTIFIVIILFLNNSPSCWSQELSGSFKAGVVEYRSGNYKKAKNIMDKIIQIEPDNYYAHYYLAISLVKLLKFDEARKHYEIVVENSDDPKIVRYSEAGLEKLAPESTAKQVEIIEVDKPETNKITVETTEQINKYSQSIDDSMNNQYQQQYNNYQNSMVSEIAKKNNIDPKELNDLIRLLANNPGAIQTLNKLASNKGGNNNSINNMDPQSIAKLVKMMTLNSQMGLLGSMTKNDNNNNNSNNNNSMDMFTMMMGQNNPMMNQMQGMQNNGNGNGMNEMQALMNYMNGNSGQNNFNPDLMNMMMNNNMMNGMGSGF